jgi:moderate conductance mechanosensitive channel
MPVPQSIRQLAQPSCVQDEGTWCARIYGITGNDVLARYADAVIGTGLQIVLILSCAVLARMLTHRAINRLLRPLREREPNGQDGTTAQDERRIARARTIGSVLRSATTLVVSAVAITMVLGQLGLNLGPIIASAGIIGLAFGFGAQNLVRDFLSGMFMIAEDQYGVGDQVDLGEAVGVVEAVGMRITTVRDEQGTVWYVRNGEVQRVGNASQGYAVAVADLPVGRDANIPAAMQIAERVAAELTGEGGTLADDVIEPPRVLGVESISPDHVTLRVTVKVRAGQQYRVKRALLAAIRAAFISAEIPFPARTTEQPTPPC